MLEPIQVIFLMKSNIIHYHWIPNGSLNADTHSNSRTINHYIQTPLQTFLHFQICEIFWSFGLQGHSSLCYIINCKTLAKGLYKKALIANHQCTTQKGIPSQARPVTPMMPIYFSKAVLQYSELSDVSATDFSASMFESKAFDSL